MLKFQITLIAILIGCMAFVACERTQDALEEVMMDPEPEMMVDTMSHKAWMSVDLPAPPTEVTMPSESGSAHGMGTRTVYFNDAAAMANMVEGAKMYPVGSTIVKEIMDDTNMFVQKIAKMVKTDDPVYDDHGGWMYVKYARADENSDYMMVGGGSFEASAGCDGCHAKAGEGNDYVFVSLKGDDAGMNGDDAGDMNDNDAG